MTVSWIARVLAVLVVVAAGCSQTDDRTDPAPATPERPEDRRASPGVVLEIRSGGDFFVPLIARGAELPVFTLYRDGRLVTERKARPGADEPAVPVLLERRLTTKGVKAVLAAARRAGLGGPHRDYLHAAWTDLPTTVFTLARDGERHVTAVYGLGILDRERAVPRAHREPRRRLLRLQARLRNLDRWLPRGSVGARRPLAYDALAVYTQPLRYWPGGRRARDAARRSATAWPLREPLSRLTRPAPGLPTVRCGVVEGRDLQRVVAATRHTEALSAWKSGGAAYVLAFRPLLPGEEPCARPFL